MALVHTLLVQKTTGGLFKTNFVLSILAFIFVLYATFLTRSGVLGDMSVHSFVDPGTFVYALLLIFILLFLIIGIFFLILRMKDMDDNKLNFSLTSKESMVTLGAIMLIISTIIIFIGTSMPIFLELAGQPKTAVEISFYDKWNLPIAVIFMLLCGFSYYLSWRSSKTAGLVKILIPFIVSIASTVILYFAGLNEIHHIILVFASIYCLYNSVLYLLQIIRKSPKSIGSFISHAGLGIFFIGVIYSGGYTESETLSLATGQTGSALGYNFTFIGTDRIEKEKQDREKYKCNIKIEKNDDISFVSPIVYWSDFNQKQAPFFEPGIYEKVTTDIYISPKSLSYENDIPSLVLNKNMDVPLPYDSTWSMKLIGFDMSHGNANQGDQPFTLSSILEFTNLGETYTDTLYMQLDVESGNSAPIWYKLKETGISIGFSNFSLNSTEMSQSQALFSFMKEGVETQGAREIFIFEISTKPFIVFVWIGSIAIVAGFFIAMFKYRKINK
jgi:cytochrome c-type biogenesis protein CcmF